MRFWSAWYPRAVLSLERGFYLSSISLHLCERHCLRRGGYVFVCKIHQKEKKKKKKPQEEEEDKSVDRERFLGFTGLGTQGPKDRISRPKPKSAVAPSPPATGSPWLNDDIFKEDRPRAGESGHQTATADRVARLCELTVVVLEIKDKYWTDLCHFNLHCIKFRATSYFSLYSYKNMSVQCSLVMRPLPSLSIHCIGNFNPTRFICLLVKESRDPSARSQRHWSLFYQQSTVLGPDIFALRTQHWMQVHGHWSGVFNLSKFDHSLKKKRNNSNPDYLIIFFIPQALYTVQHIITLQLTTMDDVWLFWGWKLAHRLLLRGGAFTPILVFLCFCFRIGNTVETDRRADGRAIYLIYIKSYTKYT